MHMLRRILQHAVSTIPILYCIHRGCLESPPSNWNYDWILRLQNFPVPSMALQTSLHDEGIRYMWIINGNSETYIWTVVEYNDVTTINILHYEGCTIHIILRSEECACSTVGDELFYIWEMRSELYLLYISGELITEHTAVLVMQLQQLLYLHP